MPQRPLKLKNPPIVEAVLDFECDFSPGMDLKALEEPASARFRDRYPKARKQVLQQLKLSGSPGDEFSHSMRQGLQALQFLQDDERALVQVRRTGFSFNRLAPYSRFNDYLPEIRRTWDLYRDIASPILVRVIRLRYINRIELPFAKGRVELGQYFKVAPRLADERRLAMAGFLNQYTAVEKATGLQVASVLTAAQPTEGRLPVIFDNAVENGEPVDPADWPAIETKLFQLRSLKNRVFKDTLTSKCLNLFR